MRRSIFSILAVCGIASILALSGGSAFAKTVKECDAEYAANKEAIKASGQKKADYVAACVPRWAPASRRSAGAPAQLPLAAATPAAAPAPVITPTPKATAAAKPAPAPAKPPVAATGAGRIHDRRTSARTLPG